MTHILIVAAVVGFFAVCIWIFYNTFVRPYEGDFVEPGYESELMCANEDAVHHINGLMRDFCRQPSRDKHELVLDAMDEHSIGYGDLNSGLVFAFFNVSQSLYSPNPEKLWPQNKQPDKPAVPTNQQPAPDGTGSVSSAS